ncbi:MAG: YfhO family protein, partial [Calditrichaeota bacterium]|nr:YfhO family protein [Calditrichota bacterium]
QQGRPSVYENTTVLPRAYFVDEIKVLADNDAFFDYLMSGDFDPHKQAVLTEEPEVQIVPSSQNKVEVTSFGIHEIALKAEVDQPALLVVSEVYYPAGWLALVDGEETKIYRADGILRAIFLQPGQHNIQFVFSPTTFKLGLGITAFILVSLLGLLFYGLRNEKKETQLATN